MVKMNIAPGRRLCDHEWDYLEWLPICEGSDPDIDSMTCSLCGDAVVFSMATADQRTQAAIKIANTMFGPSITKNHKAFMAVMDHFGVKYQEAKKARSRLPDRPVQFWEGRPL